MRRAWRVALQHQGLVWAVVRREFARYPATILAADDLATWGMLGLYRAAQRYDPRRRASFASYAYPAIRRYIRRGIEQTGFAHVRLPAYAHDLYRRYRQTGRPGRGRAWQRIVACAEPTDTPFIEPTTADDSRHLQARIDLNTLLTLLPSREATILRAYVGLSGRRPQTISAIARQWHISTARVGQIIQTSIRRLRRRILRGNIR